MTEKISGELSAHVNLRLKQSEIKEWKAKAKSVGLTLSEYIRRCIENQDISSYSQTLHHILTELVKTRCIITSHIEPQGLYNAETASALRTITACVEKLLESLEPQL